MDKRKIYSFGILIVLVFLTWTFPNSNELEDEFSSRVKIAFRDVGNKLLLTYRDSTSLILPIKALGESKYELSFENQLSILPDSIVSIVDNSFRRAKLPEHYRIEVIHCTNKEVAYSYKMSAMVENTIIPCAGRILPKNCYTIQVQFRSEKTFAFGKKIIFGLLLVVLFILVGKFVLHQKKQKRKAEEIKQKYTAIGRFQFYPEQNKLVKEAIEISLSRKECELLAIFIAHPNTIIKRDELTKKVWEDNGVIVGRSLDTYISKLRKKLKDDETIKLTNVHGVGYKLEMYS